MTSQAARSAPGSRSHVVEAVPDRRPITGERTALPSSELRCSCGAPLAACDAPRSAQRVDRWIEQAGTHERLTPWRITRRTAPRRVRVYRSGHLLKSYRAVVGKPTTPTPTGRFFVEETVLMAPGEDGGPFALALSARLDVLQEFEGGPGQIGIHGRDGLGGTLGSAESHGCVGLPATASTGSPRASARDPVTIEQG